MANWEISIMVEGYSKPVKLGEADVSTVRSGGLFYDFVDKLEKVEGFAARGPEGKTTSYGKTARVLKEV